MKRINKLTWLLIFMPLAGIAQVLGSNQGDVVEIASIAGATQNSFMNKQWLFRTQPGADWTSARLHNGIAVDNSFLTPRADTKTWWERDPYHNLQSWGNGADTYLSINGGNIGIGTTEPTVGLQLGNLNSNISSKQIMIPGQYNFERLVLGQLGNGNVALEMVNHSGIGSTSYGVRLMANIDNGGQGLQFQYATMKNDYNLLEYQTALFMAISGNIGIGTTTPSEKLAVNGKIRAQEIKVEAAPWPDYVFTKDYQLPTLQETEYHIKEKGHLPGIPSAAEVKANGIDLGEMNSKLLQKIEELTLHLVELNKRVGNLEDENKMLRSKAN